MAIAIYLFVLLVICGELQIFVSTAKRFRNSHHNKRRRDDNSKYEDPPEEGGRGHHIQYQFAAAPLITSMYTADPAVHRFGAQGTFYIYGSHDIPPSNSSYEGSDNFDMRDYHVFSLNSTLGNLTDHGVALKLEDVPWAKKQLWAPDVAYRKGRYYFYFPAKDYNDLFRIGVASSVYPHGPFIAEPKPIAGTYSVDPCVFRDPKTSRHFLYFGGLWGGQLHHFDSENHYNASSDQKYADELALLPRVAMLHENMKELAEAPREVEIIDKFGELFRESDNDKRFFEAAWMHMIGDKYYFSYSTGDTHRISYAEGKSPYGPFIYKGVVMFPVKGWTTHHSLVRGMDRNEWLVFYHDIQLSFNQTHLRNIKVQPVTIFENNGTIVPVVPYKKARGSFQSTISSPDYSPPPPVIAATDSSSTTPQTLSSINNKNIVSGERQEVPSPLSRLWSTSPLDPTLSPTIKTEPPTQAPKSMFSDVSALAQLFGFLNR